MTGSMDVECSHLTESFSTDFTLMWLFLVMNESVITKMILTTECLIADVTLEWPLIGVSSFVNEEIVGFGEMTITVWADELFLWTFRWSTVIPTVSGIHEPWSCHLVEKLVLNLELEQILTS